MALIVHDIDWGRGTIIINKNLPAGMAEVEDSAKTDASDREIEFWSTDFRTALETMLRRRRAEWLAKGEPAPETLFCEESGRHIDYSRFLRAWNRAQKLAGARQRSPHSLRHTPAARDVPVSPKILLEIYQQQNQSLPEVKALTSERLKKCRSRIDQAVRDGCPEQYLADLSSAVKKAQQTPFLRGKGARGWPASFDWFVANQVNIYAVVEGKYDGLAAAPTNGNGGNHAISSPDFDCQPGGTSSRRTSRGDPIYRPRQ